MKAFENIILPRVGELRMGETIIEKDCTGEGLPIYSADKSNRPWAYSTHFKRLNQPGTIVIGARGTIGYPRLPKEAAFGATQTTITLKPDSESFVPKFVYYALQQLDFSVLGAQQAIPMLTVGNLETVTIPWFPKPEKSKVISTVDQAIEQTESLIAKQQRDSDTKQSFVSNDVPK
ncbi:MAG: restriction endonuclease subunit S [candidate division KSB1 bacterium]|nr:restriction endonuclease subunit S [candidate division KSB1 bacterium]